MFRFLFIVFAMSVGFVDASFGAPSVERLKQEGERFLNRRSANLGSRWIELKTATAVDFYSISDLELDSDFENSRSGPAYFGVFQVDRAGLNAEKFGLIYDEKGEVVKAVKFEDFYKECPQGITDLGKFVIRYIPVTRFTEDDAGLAESIALRSKVLVAIFTKLKEAKLSSNFERVETNLVPRNDEFERKEWIHFSDSLHFYENEVRAVIDGLVIDGVKFIFTSTDLAANAEGICKKLN